MFSKGINEYHLADESVTWMLICRFTDHWCHHKGMCGLLIFEFMFYLLVLFRGARYLHIK
jgi:hypothetical protein